MPDPFKIAANELLWAIAHLKEAHLRVMNTHVHFREGVTADDDVLLEAGDKIKSVLSICAAFHAKIQELDRQSQN